MNIQMYIKLNNIYNKKLDNKAIKANINKQSE